MSSAPFPNDGTPQSSPLERAFAPDGLDLNRLIAAFRSRLPLFLAVALVVLVAGIVVTMQATPVYTSEARVLLDMRRDKVADVEAVVSGLSSTAETVSTEVEVIRSRQLATRVVDALNLTEDPEFNRSLRKPTGMAAAVAGAKRLFGGAPKPEEPMTPARLARIKEGVVSAVIARLTTARLGETFVISIGFTSEDPRKAARIADAFAERYLLETLEAKFDATRQANVWLSDRLSQLRGELQQAENAVEQYRQANNLLSASGTTLTEQEISTYNTQLAGVRAQQAEDEARLRTARQQLAAGSSGGDVGEALGSGVIQSLRSQQAAASGRLAEAERRYGPLHPDRLRAQREVADLDTQIQDEIGRIISNLEARVQVARDRTNSMAGSLGRARGTLASNNAASVRLAELTRNAESVRTLYEGLLGRFRETTSQDGLEQSDGRVVSKAQTPRKPSAPNVPLSLALSIIMAVIAGSFVVFIAHLLDTGLMTSADIEQRLGLPSLGIIPHLRSVADPGERAISPVDYILKRPLSGFSEAVRSVKTSLIYAPHGRKMKVIVVTSALPDEGKTTTAICLARSMAQAGSSVVLVDCDLRRRNVTRLLGQEPQQGLLEVLSGAATVESVLIQDEASGVSYLPVAPGNFTPRDVFSSDAMKGLLERLSATFDVVLLDTAPVLAVAETRTIAAQADAVLLLARWRKTPLKAVEAARRTLEQAGAPITGVALSQVNMRQQAKYGYGDAGYYYGEYKKYYAA